MITQPAGVGPVDHEVRPFAWASKSGGSFVSDEARNNVPIYREVYMQPLVTLAQAEAMVSAERERWRDLAQRLAHQGNARGLEGMAVRCTISESGAVVSWEVDRGPNDGDERRR